METAKIEIRTCKTCGETKPLEEGFYKTGSEYSRKVHYRHICKRCLSEAHKANYAPKKGEAEIDEAASLALAAAIRAQEEARAVINLFESIKAAHQACPILGLGLWTGDVPQRLGAW